MKNNQEFYKKTFSKLHSSAGMPELSGNRTRIRNPVFACLAVLLFLSISVTGVYAMTDGKPIEFLRSFFSNADDTAAEELIGTYVEVSDQQIYFEDLTITLQGYSFTENILLAEINVSSDVNSTIDFERVNHLSFMLDQTSGGTSTELIRMPDGSVNIAVRMNYHDWQSESGSIVVWNSYMEDPDQIGTFMIENPVSVAKLVLTEVELPACTRVVMTGTNMHLYFVFAERPEKNRPVKSIRLNMKSGEVIPVFDEEKRFVDSGIVNGTTFGWSIGRESEMTLDFSRIIDIENVEEIVIDDIAYQPTLE